MQRPSPTRTPEETIALAKRNIWYTRLWWVVLHAAVYAWLVHSSAWSAYFNQWATGMATCLGLAVATGGSYVCLQCSSPGFVKQVKRSDEVDDAVDDAVATDDSNASLLDEITARHFCAFCNVHPPLRAKHCKDCGRCVEQYDHHCVCAGVCVGRDNHRIFVLYLLLETVETFWVATIAAASMSFQDSAEAWFAANTAFVLIWFLSGLSFLVAFGLLCYHAFLISTNQSSWEHAKRANITYLKDLPDDKLPFSQGTLVNTMLFLRGQPRDVWVLSDANPYAEDAAIADVV
ncbi:Aste57867_10152 [Aphanomyces stellatus]|uniref:Palmitoyltransferase n=1 Tax=Aphanomyces stellatus TaxID=120398 RepID=A0A485KQD6_9STRA|nr:hypothetical protein As57867_010113 [Aphanomyces stellatus]VFT87028.1 Aste57867_10152 [Aphanomyces stellatus]